MKDTLGIAVAGVGQPGWICRLYLPGSLSCTMNRLGKRIPKRHLLVERLAEDGSEFVMNCQLTTDKAGDLEIKHKSLCPTIRTGEIKSKSTAMAGVEEDKRFVIYQSWRS